MKVNRNFYFFLWNIMWAIAFLAMAYTSNAQSIPGRWHKVALPQPDGGGNDNTEDFSFIDSLHGIWLSDEGLISSTSDGGRSWSIDTNTNNDYIYKFNLNSVDCVAPHHGFYHSTGETLIITPGGTNFSSVAPNVNEVNLGAYWTLAEKMYDTLYGFRLVEYVSPEALDQFQDSVPIIVTHDGWKSSSLYGSAYILYPDSTLAQVESMRMPIGCIIDSNNVWAVKQNTVLHTSNGGTSWDSSVVLDSVLYQLDIKDFYVNPKTHELLYMGINDVVDYAYSSDDGTTWRLDSTFGVHLWRIANPAPGILWAMIGESGSGEVAGKIQLFPPSDVFGTYYENDYSRKIAYSSDTGHTWIIDSTTFINDSLEEMHFLDARHGWIASWSNDSIYMWYYDADDNSNVVEHYHTSLYTPAPKPIIYPNPASETINIAAPGQSGQVILLDMLGRQMRNATLPSSGEVQFDVSSLPTGIYFLVAGSLTSNLLKE